MAESVFTAPTAPGAATQAAFRGIDFGQSMMERASAMRNQEELMQMRRAEHAIMLPLREAQAAAEIAKARTSYQSAINMQKTMENLYPMAEKARMDFNFINQIEDADARAKASVEWLSRYQQLTNLKDLEPEFSSLSNLAAKNVASFAAIRGTEEAFFNRLTAGMSEADTQKAKRVKLGLDNRQSGAAIQYREVVGPDGVARLVAVDPRAVGAQVVGTGESFGSGVSASPERTARDAGQMPQDRTTLESQSVFEKARDTEAGKSSAEYQAKLRENRPKRTAALRQAEISTNRLSEDIDGLIREVSAATAGPGGVILDKFPGTTARDFASNLDSIKARLGFQALQAMREASPTGGALGNITERENTLLQNQLGSLEIGQSPTQLLENLRKVRQRLIESYGVIRSAYDSEYGDAAPSAPVWDEAKQRRLDELKEKLGK
jgi:hypothetical protein